MLYNAAMDIAEVMKFENWIRFYFSKEAQDSDGVLIQVDTRNVKNVKEQQPHLFELLQRYQGQIIDYKKSCNEVCVYVNGLYDGPKYKSGIISTAFDSKELKIEMYLFGMWLQSHELKLEKELLSFCGWIEIYEDWKNTPEVKNYLEQLTTVEDNGRPSKKQ